MIEMKSMNLGNNSNNNSQGTYICSYCESETQTIDGPIDYPLCPSCGDKFVFDTDGPYEAYLALCKSQKVNKLGINNNTNNSLDNFELQEEEDEDNYLDDDLDELLNYKVDDVVRIISNNVFKDKRGRCCYSCLLRCGVKTTFTFPNLSLWLYKRVYSCL